MLQRKKLSRDCGAFTLIEVALAATVLLFAIVSAFQIVAAGTRMLDFSRKQTIATQIIRAEIDYAHTTNWATVRSMAGTTDTVTLNSLTSSNTWTNSSLGYPELVTFKTMINLETSVAAGTNFTVKRVVSPIPYPDDPVNWPLVWAKGRSDVVEIRFTVTWTAKMWSDKNGTGHTYSRQGTTCVSKNGLSATYQRP